MREVLSNVLEKSQGRVKSVGFTWTKNFTFCLADLIFLGSEFKY